MCVIILKPAYKSIPKEKLRNCYLHNTDGWGIMYPSNGSLNIIRGMGNFEAFYKAYRDVPHSAHMAVHFRYATHGSKNIDNCHPFVVMSKLEGDTTDLAVMHNGVIHDYNSTHENMSDTWHFVEHDLKPLLANDSLLLDDPDTFGLIEHTTAGSKLLFMDGDGNVKVTNKDMWHKEFGCAFSNSYSLSKPYSASYGNYGAGGYGGYDGFEDAYYSDNDFGRGVTGVGSRQSSFNYSKVKTGTAVYANGRTAACAAVDCTPSNDYFDDEDAYNVYLVRQMSEADLFEFIVEYPEKATDIMLELLR